jgi:hypothetical protein
MSNIGIGFGGPAPTNFTTFNPIAVTRFPIGTPVTSASPPLHGINEILPANATIGPGNTQFVIGIAATPGNAGQSVNIKYLGPIDLTIEQWDVITGQVGGLTPGQQYYLSSGAQGTGKMQTIPANVNDDTAARSVIGRALSPTTLFVQPRA